MDYGYQWLYASWCYFVGWKVQKFEILHGFIHKLENIFQQKDSTICYSIASQVDILNKRRNGPLKESLNTFSKKLIEF